MKPTVSMFFVVFFALAVVSANHHKRHRGNSVKFEEYYTTYEPTEVTYSDGGDFQWPDRAHIRNVELPKTFGPGRSDMRSESMPAKQHRKSGHGPYSH